MNHLLQRIAKPFMDNRNPNLCSVCRPLFTGQRKDKELGVPATELLPQTVQQLEHTATHGCDLCRLRWNQLKPEERSDLGNCDKITYGFWQSRVGDGVVFEYWLDTWEGGLKPRVSRSVKLKKHSGRSHSLIFKHSGRANNCVRCSYANHWELVCWRLHFQL